MRDHTGGVGWGGNLWRTKIIAGLEIFLSPNCFCTCGNGHSSWHMHINMVCCYCPVPSVQDAWHMVQRMKGGLCLIYSVWPGCFQLCSLSSSSRQAPCSALTPALCCDADIAPPLWAFIWGCESKLKEIKGLLFKIRCLRIQRNYYKNWPKWAGIDSICTGTAFSGYVGPVSSHGLKSLLSLYFLLYSFINSQSQQSLFSLQSK